MASTPNFAWPTPDDTDPVGDGALDIRTLANAIDSQVFAGGLVLVKSQVVGSGVSSVAVTNAFSSLYDNYLITLNGGTVSTDASMSMILGASSTGYYGFMSYGQANTSTPLGAGRNNAVNAAWVGGGTSGQMCHVRVEVFGPFAARYTKLLNSSYQNGIAYGIMNGEHRVATSFTGFTLSPDAGTLTGGTIRVYGYRN